MLNHIHQLNLSDKLEYVESLRAETEKRMTEILGQPVSLEVAVYKATQETIDAALQLKWPATRFSDLDLGWVVSNDGSGSTVLFPDKEFTIRV